VNPEIYWIAAGALAVALLLTGIMRRLALARGLLDVPNARSSHSVPTPRGGGVAIVVASMAACLALEARGLLDAPLTLALLGGGGAVAVIGFIDDRRSVSPGTRLLVQLLAAAWALYFLGGLQPVQVGSQTFDLGVWGDLLAAVAIVWTTNLFNFMDGIDGIAASEATFMCVLGAVLATWVFGAPGEAGASLVLGSAAAGFLAWNWPPARIFMGDVGSGFLGFSLAVLPLAVARHESAASFVWLILGAAFFVDATVTMVRRWLRGARVHEAHREHAYQRLARRWSSHRTVDLALWAINLGWLAPLACYAAVNPTLAGSLALIAVAPLAVLAIGVGAGRAE
jgi:Fuc2NAc and GlcNAc transferase